MVRYVFLLKNFLISKPKFKNGQKIYVQNHFFKKTFENKNFTHFLPLSRKIHKYILFFCCS